LLIQISSLILYQKKIEILKKSGFKMHELSIAQSILEIVQKEMKERRLAAVKEICVEVGALSGVLPDALQFGFEVIIIDTPLAGCRFTIKEIPVRGNCRECDKDFEVKIFMFCCPFCNSGQIAITSGEELDIAYLEVEEGLPEDAYP